jgi:hypothetical protein
MINEHKITVDIYAKNSGDQQLKYRLYVDNDLLTERDFKWPCHKVYIKENILVNLEPGTHHIRVETIGNGTINAKNITVDGVVSLPEFITVE